MLVPADTMVGLSGSFFKQFVKLHYTAPSSLLFDRLQQFSKQPFLPLPELDKLMFPLFLPLLLYILPEQKPKPKPIQHQGSQYVTASLPNAESACILPMQTSLLDDDHQASTLQFVENLQPAGTQLSRASQGRNAQEQHAEAQLAACREGIVCMAFPSHAEMPGRSLI